MTEEEQVVILEQGSPEAQKIAKAMSSATASDLINLLSDEGPMTATEIAEKMHIPLTSLKYHLENLLDAGLIEVSSTRWSEKGKRMKIYGVIEKDIVLKPKKRSEATKLLGKYGVAAGASAIICAGIPLLTRVLPSSETENITLEPFMTTISGSEDTFENALLSEAAEQVSALSTVDAVFIVIFLVIIATLAIMLLLRLSRVKRA